MNSANMLGSLGGVLLLGIAGRKTLMVINQVLVVVFLFIMFYASHAAKDTLELDKTNRVA